MTILETHIVPDLDKPIRIQDYAVGKFITASTKSAIKKAIKKELLLVDEKVCSTGLFLQGGESISLLEEEKKHKEFDFQLEILYEDDHLAVINKPAGISVSGNSFATIDNALSKNLQKSKQHDAVRPRPVHRLDYLTSGVLLIGKTTKAIHKLGLAFQNKEIEKIYYAITIGEMKKQGNMDTPIDGKESFSTYEVVASTRSVRFGFLNLVKLSPKTGRRHQLRKHLANLGNPILGDKDYGKKDLILTGKGLYLHAESLKFKHPISEEFLQVSSPLPKKFNKIF